MRKSRSEGVADAQNNTPVPPSIINRVFNDKDRLTERASAVCAQYQTTRWAALTLLRATQLIHYVIR